MEPDVHYSVLCVDEQVWELRRLASGVQVMEFVEDDDDRVAYPVEQMTQAELDALAKSEAPEEAKQFDHEVED